MMLYNRAVVFKPLCALGTYHKLVKTYLTELHPDSVGLGWGPRISIFNRFPGDDDAAGLVTTLRATLLEKGGGSGVIEKKTGPWMHKIRIFLSWLCCLRVIEGQ